MVSGIFIAYYFKMQQFLLSHENKPRRHVKEREEKQKKSA